MEYLSSSWAHVTWYKEGAWGCVYINYTRIKYTNYTLIWVKHAKNLLLTIRMLGCWLKSFNYNWHIYNLSYLTCFTCKTLIENKCHYLDDQDVYIEIKCIVNVWTNINVTNSDRCSFLTSFTSPRCRWCMTDAKIWCKNIAASNSEATFLCC